MRKAICYIFLLSITACENRQPKKEVPVEMTEKDSIPEVSSKTEIKIESRVPLIEIRYHAVPVTRSLIDRPDSFFTPEQLKIVLALNRIDRFHIWRTDSLIVPDTFLVDLNSYSPFPDTLPVVSEVKKFLLFSYAIQAFAVYEEGLLKRWGPVSMGKRSTPTPKGLFFTNWKSKETISTVDEEWVMPWYFNFVNFKGVSMHEYDLPGYPASHACIRLLEEDAKWLFEWADQWVLSVDDRILVYGTPVFIYGEYSFGKRKPWKNLNTDSNFTQQSTDSLKKLIEPFLVEILEKQTGRDSFNLGLEKDEISVNK